LSMREEVVEARPRARLLELRAQTRKLDFGHSTTRFEHGCELAAAATIRGKRKLALFTHERQHAALELAHAFPREAPVRNQAAHFRFVHAARVFAKSAGLVELFYARCHVA